ncbi:AAA family ATPase [Streptomyces diastaticus]|uniref:AAA family ATPase n=1 Tax=Streptomyces diastaticus TaxID=1956 RepID=UPI0034451E99
MKVRRLTLQNFRGVRAGTVYLTGHSLLVGSNSVGKSTVCEALELVLGPERMFRRPVVDEHDFYGSRYQETDGDLPEIRVEAVLTDLSPAAELNRSGIGGGSMRWLQPPVGAGVERSSWSRARGAGCSQSRCGDAGC